MNFYSFSKSKNRIINSFIKYFDDMNKSKAYAIKLFKHNTEIVATNNIIFSSKYWITCSIKIKRCSQNNLNFFITDSIIIS